MWAFGHGVFVAMMALWAGEKVLRGSNFLAEFFSFFLVLVCVCVTQLSEFQEGLGGGRVYTVCRYRVSVVAPGYF